MLRLPLLGCCSWTSARHSFTGGVYHEISPPVQQSEFLVVLVVFLVINIVNKFASLRNNNTNSTSINE